MEIILKYFLNLKKLLIYLCQDNKKKNKKIIRKNGKLSNLIKNFLTKRESLRILKN